MLSFETQIKLKNVSNNVLKTHRKKLYKRFSSCLALLDQSIWGLHDDASDDRWPRQRVARCETKSHGGRRSDAKFTWPVLSCCDLQLSLSKASVVYQHLTKQSFLIVVSWMWTSDDFWTGPKSGWIECYGYSLRRHCWYRTIQASGALALDVDTLDIPRYNMIGCCWDMLEYVTVVCSIDRLIHALG